MDNFHVTTFDPDADDNQTCKNCAQPWYTWCRIKIALKLRREPIHCGTKFGFVRV